MADNAAIYIADPTMLGSRLFALFPEVRSAKDKSEGDVATGLTLDIGQAVIDMNFMLSAETPAHLQGFSGYVQHIFDGSRDDLVYTLSRIKQVNFVIGCVIEPGFDEADTTLNFLVALTNRLNGLLFVYDSIVDFDGQVLAGPLQEPQ